MLTAIWQAMDNMIQHCQQTVIHRVGIFVRLEAIRTEKHQTRYHPLQGYMNAKLVQEYGRPWKQIVMFIGRTYQQQEWKVPTYRFNQKQRTAWEEVIARAWEFIENNGRERVYEYEEVDSNSDQPPQTGESDASLQDSSPHDHYALAPFPKACLNFYMSLLDEWITQSEYHSVMICALAVLGVKKDGWLGVDRYPSILSAIIKISRFMVIQFALEIAGSAETDSSSDDCQRSEYAQPQCLEVVTAAMDRFMIRGSHSPMQWMLDLRTYGMKIHYRTTVEGTIDWIGDQIVYRNIQFTMPELRSMIHHLVAETKQILIQQLLFITDSHHVPEIPWSSLRDNPVNQERGWNFVRDERNPWPVNGRTWLRDRIGEDDGIRRRFIEDGPRLQWNPAKIRRYMDDVVDFRGRFFVAVHMTEGQPARTPELLSIRHSNSIRGEYRNVFIEDGMVVIVTRYHKGYHVRGQEKIIHRYLPREVGELLVYFEWLVRPFVELVEAEVWDRYTVSPFIWPPDSQGKEWTSARMSQCMQDASQRGLGVTIGIQAWREVAIGISRKFLREKHAFRPDEDDEDGDFHEDKADEIQDEQAGHTSHVAGMVYARGIMELSGVVASKRQRFREASIEWHRFLGFNFIGGPRKMPFTSEAEDVSFQRWKRLRGIDIPVELTRMMGSHARFRGVQEAAIRSIIHGDSPVVVVMGTGGGKSLVFMLPAWCSSGGTSIVVVPLIALRQDMKDRCRQFGITCVE